jgi:hypothetical protein
MRRNVFNEAYCHTVDELLGEIGRHDITPAEVYVDGELIDEGDEGYSTEVFESVEGETICHFEAPSKDEILAAMKTAGVAVI